MSNFFFKTTVLPSTINSLFCLYSKSTTLHQHYSYSKITLLFFPICINFNYRNTGRIHLPLGWHLSKYYLWMNKPFIKNRDMYVMWWARFHLKKKLLEFSDAKETKIQLFLSKFLNGHMPYLYTLHTFLPTLPTFCSIKQISIESIYHISSLGICLSKLWAATLKYPSVVINSEEFTVQNIC